MEMFSLTAHVSICDIACGPVYIGLSLHASLKPRPFHCYSIIHNPRSVKHEAQIQYKSEHFKPAVFLSVQEIAMETGIKSQYFLCYLPDGNDH